MSPLRPAPIPARTVSAPRGLTLVEMLVVLAVVVAMMAVATLSLTAMRSHKSTRRGTEAIESAIRFARQYAVTYRTCCMLEVVAVDDNATARPTPPGTPYKTADEGGRDKLRLRPLLRQRDDQTGGTKYVVGTEILKVIELPANLVFDDERGTNRRYPANASVECQSKDGTLPTREFIYFLFRPDGTCTSTVATSTLTASSEPTTEGTVLGLRDLVSGEVALIPVLSHRGASSVSTRVLSP